MKKYNKKNNSGYALYMAIIITALLILVAYATANLSIEQLALSTSASESHIAFYNADTGLECAQYADLKNGAISAFDSGTAGSITCDGQTVTTGSQTVQTTPTQTSVVGGAATSIFQLNLTEGCVIVTVTKSNVAPMTTINSRGYNSCTGSSRLERGITIQY